MDHCCIEILDYGWNDQPVCQPRSDHGPWTKSLFLHRLEHVRLSLLPRISEHGLYRFWPTRRKEYPEDKVRCRYKICSICVAIILILAYSYLIVNKLCWYFLQKSWPRVPLTGYWWRQHLLLWSLFSFPNAVSKN